MKVYDELREEILTALAEFKHYYRDHNLKIPVERKKNIHDIQSIIAHHDQQRQAYELRQSIRSYVKGLTYRVFACWVPGFSVTYLQTLVLNVIWQAKNREDQIHLRVRDEFMAKLSSREARANAVVEQRYGALNLRLKQKTRELNLAKAEVQRLQVENDFLTEQIELLHNETSSPVSSAQNRVNRTDQISFWAEKKSQQRQVRAPDFLLSSGVVK